MCSTGDSGKGNGTKGSSRTNLDNYSLENVSKQNNGSKPKVYVPSPKHDKGGWGTQNPVNDPEEGQHLLNTGYTDGKQVYNVTKDGKIVKFQPANTPKNEYHSYEVSKPRDLPSEIRKKMEKDGLISKSDSNKLRKGKKKKK